MRDVLIHASSTITIGEYQHDVPTIVVACIEELSRTGILFSSSIDSSFMHVRYLPTRLIPRIA